ncbi:hypothetical protein ANCCEY_08974 [Ancylostoma ceylanicum]|uniref:Uncharacterized protein n=1 Tax=Ancylostoma ceylanicum TaxID=53326 RepID=A0A0D6LLA0_9BILA|nr:hypothetical protein ANCCEY_08974 [Ancylostoma ceylanicum]
MKRLPAANDGLAKIDYFINPERNPGNRSTLAKNNVFCKGNEEWSTTGVFVVRGRPAIDQWRGSILHHDWHKEPCSSLNDETQTFCN